MWRRNRQRRNVTRVPVILVSRMQDTPQVGLNCRTNQRAAIHDPGDVFQPLRDLDMVNGCIDRRKRAEDLFHVQPFFKG